MPRTEMQKLISHKQKRKGLLVPLLEDLFQLPVEIQTDEDVEWIAGVLKMMTERQQRRTSDPVFSPSQLSECLRYVYLLKNYKEHGITKQRSVRVQPNFFFFNGHWLHLKWQYALYKLDQKLPDDVFKLVGVEVPILSKHKDHGGTVDALVLIYGEPFIVDFKGLNVRSFGEIAHGNIPLQYILQLADYGMLYNSQKNGAKILRALLVSENKGGPTPKNLIALQESEIEIEVYLPAVRKRLKELREHEQANSIPLPECVSTQSYQYQGCPFRQFCKEEVRAIARQRAAENRDTEKLAVARPRRSGNHRSRRNSE